MKVNIDKSHLFISANKVIANIDDNSIMSRDIYKHLGITIDSKLAFATHINKFCKTASQKLNVLAHISNYMALHKRKIIMKALTIASQFSYCPLVWMFHSKKLGKKINALHERTLRITYGGKMSSFNELLEKNNSASVYHKKLQALGMEMYKISNNMPPTIFNDIFASRRGGGGYPLQPAQLGYFENVRSLFDLQYY